MVAEISLLTAVPSLELWELWQRTGRDEPPFWAYPWAGGQALARYVLDNPGIVAGRRVLDVASGSGLVAIAAARAGAASVVAGDIDPHAVAAIAINASANGVAVDARPFDLAADGHGDAEVVLAGDVFYQRELAALALRFVRGGDHGRSRRPGRRPRPRVRARPFAHRPGPLRGSCADRHRRRPG